MQIRKATINDIKLIVEIWLEFLCEHDGIVASRNRQLKEMNLRNAAAHSIYGKLSVQIGRAHV